MTHLETAARRLVEGARHPPYLYGIGPADARLALELMQAPPETARRRVRIPTPHGPIEASVLTPPTPHPHTIVYVHGGGFTLGSYATHHRLAQALCSATGARVVVPEYTRVPEARYPVAVEQLAATLDWIGADWSGAGLIGAGLSGAGLSGAGSPHAVATVGDCAGATLALSLALRHRPPLAAQVLLYPLGLPAAADRSATEFATGAALRLTDVRKLFRDYAPRAERESDPLHATDVRGLPPTLLVSAEADVTRDLTERFGNRLRAAGVPVTALRYLGTIHDFAVLDALRWTPSARSVIAQVTDYLRTAFTEPAPAGPAPAGPAPAGPAPAGPACVGPACVGSACVGPACVGPACVGSACVGPVSVGSGCVGSGCVGSVSVGAACSGPACVGSVCAGSVCGGAACVGRAHG